MKKTAIYIAASLCIAAGSISKANGQDGNQPTEFDGIVRLDRTIYDFGDVTTDAGPLTCTFTVTNISDKATVIYNVVSSCGCTGVKWTREPLKPGSTGSITATYTNMEGPYPFDKTLTAYISGVKKPVVLRLRGIVHDKKLPLNKLYPERMGQIGLKKVEFNIGNLSQGGQKSDATFVANLGNSAAEVKFTGISTGLSVYLSPNPIPVGETARMTYTVKADRSKWGRNYYEATLVVNGQVQKPLKFTAFTKEDFSGWTAAQQENGAQPVFDHSTFRFGKVQRGTPIEASFPVKNLGGETFHVYKTDSGLEGTSISARCPDVKSGDNGVFTFTLDTSELTAGAADISLILTTNSPIRPVISLYISGNVY